MASDDGRALLWTLAEFRKRAEKEAGVPCHEITTTVGAALLDVCQALTLDDSQTRIVIGDAAYRAIADQPIPFTLTQEVDRVQQAAVP